MNRPSLFATFSLPALAALAVATTTSAQDTTPPTASGGFWTGLRGFEDFHEPVGQPL